MFIAQTARQRGGDFAGFAVLAGQVFVAVAALFAAIALAGLWYMTRPHVKSAFGLHASA